MSELRRGTIDKLRAVLARVVLGLWPFSFAIDSLMILLRPPPLVGTRRRRLRGFPLIVEYDASTYIGNYLEYRGIYEDNIVRVLERRLREGMVFVDIGANIGTHSLVAAHLVGRRGRVIAVEPQVSFANGLRRSAEENGLSNIHVESVAVGRCSGSAILYDMSASNPGLATLAGDRIEKATPIAEVQVRTLDEILAEQKITAIDLVKIDVEGFEMEVLAGAQVTLRERRPTAILVECIDAHLRRGKSSAKELQQFLYTSGYDLARYRAGRWLPCNPGDVVNTDILALRRD